MKNKHLLLFIALILFLYPVSASGAWTPMTSGTTNWLSGVWGSSGSDVFAVGLNGTILHYNGSTWSSMTSGTTNGLGGVWGSSASDVFAVGSSGKILHYNGSTWSSMTSGTSYDLWGVWGSSGNDVFAVGDSGTIVHYNGSTWSTMNSGVPTYDLNDIWGSSGNDVFAVGYEGVGGTIMQYDGTIWSPIMKAEKTLSFTSVWGSSHNDVFAVGLDVALIGIDSSKQNTIYHYNGTTWSLMTVGYSVLALNGVWGSSGADVFAVGRGGTILHYTEPTLINLSSFSAHAHDREIILKWSTGTEIDNAGFNLYRATAEDGEYDKINNALITAEGSSTQGAFYQFIDTGVQNRKTYYYKLEDIDLSGKSTMHGPVSATPRLIYNLWK